MSRVRQRKLAAPLLFDARIMTPEQIQRFMALVGFDPETGCWPWLGHKDHNGYGQFKLNGKACWSHRISEALFKGGRIIAGKEVDHTRRCVLGSSCVCPWHTRKLSHRHNSRDGAKRRWEEPCPI